MKVLLLLTIFSMTACITDAQSTHELSKRAGDSTSLELTNYDYRNADIKLENTSKKDVDLYITSPKVAKVWMFDHKINGNQWMQGTWIHLKVEEGDWKINDSSIVD